MISRWSDVRYALRSLRRDAAFSVVVILTLAVGIGFNTAVFSVVRSVLLAPLPYQDSDRLVTVWSEIPSQGVQRATSSFGNIQDWRAQNRVFEDVATFDPISLTLTDGEWPELISGAKASANLFSVLGVVPELGRTFAAEEEQQRSAVAVLSHELWQRRFAASPDAIGDAVEIGGTSFQVIGVMPEGFGFPERETELWLPQTWFSGAEVTTTARGTGPWSVVARLHPGVSLEQAREGMNVIARRLEQVYPTANRGLRTHAVFLQDQVTGGSFRLGLWSLFGAVGLVLLIATANGAHMILARGMNRSHEFALRLALGATSPRLIRQVLAESLVLAGVAGVAGFLLAAGGVRLLVALAPGNVPRLDEIGIDSVVLIYATVVSLAVGMLFGIAPALGFSRIPLADFLRAGRGPSRRSRGHYARKLLMVFQFALAIVLVFGASLLVRSLLQVRAVDPGFDPSNVLMSNLSVAAPERRQPFYQQVVEDVGAIPAVRAAGVVEDLFISGTPNRAVYTEGSASTAATPVPLRIDAIAGEFFDAIGSPILAGRGFSSRDGAESAPVAIINEEMARRFWPGESPLGRRFRTGDQGPEDPWIEVVGVVGDMYRQGPETPPIPQVFRPYSQAPSRNMVLLARTDGPVIGLGAEIRARVAAIDRTVPLYSITTVEEALDRFLLQRRFQTLLLGLFSGVALLLAAVGIYGLMQYAVSQRVREIGVRIALGGSSGQVMTLILRQALAIALPGLAAGIVCALMLSHALSALFFRVSVFDITNLALTVGILLLTTIAACYIPARRAARVDPMRALRQW